MTERAWIVDGSFVLQTHWCERVLRLELVGELDIVWAASFICSIEGVIESPLVIEDVLVDLSGVRFVDLIGLRALAVGCGRLRDAAGRLQVRGAERQVLRVMHLSRIHIPGLVIEGDHRRQICTCPSVPRRTT